jgi:hypothetical protein
MSDDNEHGYIVIRRGKPAAEPFLAGHLVDVYPLDAPLDLSGHSRRRGVWAGPESPHAAANRLGEAVTVAAPRLPELARLTCPCSETDPRTLARVLAGPDGHAWALIAREKVPAAFRAGRRDQSLPLPLHSEADGPHVELTTCPKCRRSWAVVLTWTSVTRVDVSRPLYSRRVVE